MVQAAGARLGLSGGGPVEEARLPAMEGWLWKAGGEKASKKKQKRYFILHSGSRARHSLSPARFMAMPLPL